MSLRDRATAAYGTKKALDEDEQKKELAEHTAIFIKLVKKILGVDIDVTYPSAVIEGLKFDLEYRLEDKVKNPKRVPTLVVYAPSNYGGDSHQTVRSLEDLGFIIEHDDPPKFD